MVSLRAYGDRERTTDEDAVTVSPDEEDAFEQMVAETDEDLRAGRCVRWEDFLANRDARRAR